MFYSLMMYELHEKYPNLDDILSRHLPIDASCIAHTLGISDSLSADLKLIFDLSNRYNVIIRYWEDLRKVLQFVLSKERILKSLAFNEENLREILLRASEAQMKEIPLIPGYDGKRLVYRFTYHRYGSVSSGVEFEEYCAALLDRNGFTNIETTPGSGDHGVDITADKDFMTYAFQCKYYSSPVGNSAIQEVFSGKSIYKKQIGVVMTNSTFTKQAIEDAEKLSVILWDGDTLKAMG